MWNWEAVPTTSAIGQTAEGVAGDLQKLKASACACYKLDATNNFVNLAEEPPPRPLGENIAKMTPLFKSSHIPRPQKQ